MPKYRGRNLNTGCVQTYGGIKTYRRVSKHMGLSKHGGIQTYRGYPNIWGHPNIQGAIQRYGCTQAYRGIQTCGGCPAIYLKSDHHQILSRKVEMRFCISSGQNIGQYIGHLAAVFFLFNTQCKTQRNITQCKTQRNILKNG